MMADQQRSLERTDLTVPADLRQVRILRLVVAGTLSLHPIETGVVDDVCSAVDEACTLVLGPDDTPGWLSLTLRCRPGEISALVTGTFDHTPARHAETVRDAEAMLRIFVDLCDVELEYNRVTFSRSYQGVEGV